MITNFRLLLRTCIALLIFLIPGEGGYAQQSTTKPEGIVKQLRVPAGFTISVFAGNVPGARSLTHGGDGIIFVGTRGNSVYAVTYQQGSGKASEVLTVAAGLIMPNGVAFKNGSLYIAEISRVTRYDNILNQLKSPPKPVVVRNDFPTEQHHGWKFIAFGPDGKLYIPIGAPCNVCKEKDYRYATLMRMDADGSNLELYASGIRNTVGFDWHPQTKQLWFTDNGRDMLGDDIPPDELNIATTKGQNFGFPYLHGSSVVDPEFGKNADIKQFTKPVLEMQAHSAALGCRFYTGNAFPSKYKNQLFIAQHGSWNRSSKVGYRVSVAMQNSKGTVTEEPFITGWLRGQEVLGRPVDVLMMKDGSLLISDDLAGCIYRVTYSGKKH